MTLRRPIVALAFGIALGATSMAAAVDYPPPSGSVNANGRGVAVANGRVVFTGAVKSRAVLVIHDRLPADHPGAAMLRVGGREIQPRPYTPRPPFVSVRRVTIKKGTRRIYLTGQDVRVQVRARRMSLAGSGWFTLRLNGTGTHRVDTRRRVRWNPRRLLLVGNIQPPAAS